MESNHNDLDYFGFKKIKNPLKSRSVILNLLAFFTVLLIMFTAVLVFMLYRYYPVMGNANAGSVKTGGILESSDYYKPRVIEPNANNKLIDYNPKTGSVEVESGVRILFKNEKHPEKSSYCTLTVISQEYALTAGHCENSDDKYYYASYNVRGQESVFKIAHVQETWKADQGSNPFKDYMDVSLLKFEKPFVGVTPHNKDVQPKELRDGDKITTYGSTTGASYGRVVAKNFYVDKDSFTKGNYVTLVNNSVHHGDSGGVVYDSDGDIVGIINYTTESGYSGITPISKIFNTLKTLHR